MESKLKFNNFLKLVGGAIATVFLGAIGSGLWERILSPGLQSLSNFITSTLSSISVTYSDSIYSRASLLRDYDQSSSVLLALLLFVFIWLFVFALSSKKENRIVFLLHKAIVGYFTGWFGIIYSGSLLVFIFFMFSTESTVANIKSYSSKNMEIVRPYIGEVEYLKLRSEYLRIESENDFEQFLQHLHDASSKGEVEIPKFGE